MIIWNLNCQFFKPVPFKENRPEVQAYFPASFERSNFRSELAIAKPRDYALGVIVVESFNPNLSYEVIRALSFDKLHVRRRLGRYLNNLVKEDLVAPRGS